MSTVRVHKVTAGVVTTDRVRVYQVAVGANHVPDTVRVYQVAIGAARTVEPLSTVTLPAGTWTQTAGPTVTVTDGAFTAPADPTGVTLQFVASTGGVVIYRVLPHTVWMKTDDGLVPLTLAS